MIEKTRASVAERLLQRRRRLAEEDFYAFLQLYLGSHLTRRPSRFHRWLFEHLQHLPEGAGQRSAIAAPRGHAKSTIVSLAYLLWVIVTGRHQFVFLVSATFAQAEQLLKTVKEELRQNPQLRRDFPEICSPPGKQLERWRREQIELPNGAAVRALSARQEFRGIKHGRHRPSLILVDDLEDAEGVLHETQRQKLRDWFFTSLLNAGTPRTNVVMVGTVMHRHALLAQLLDRRLNPGWSGKRFQAIEQDAQDNDAWETWEQIYRGIHPDAEEQGPEAARAFFQRNKQKMLKGTRVLWPGQEDYHTLREMRLVYGRWHFAAEKQNDPIDPADCVFDVNALHYWDDQTPDTPAALVQRLGRNAFICGACDPGLGRGGDFTAIVTVAYDRSSNLYYVLDADIAQRPPHATIERIVELSKLYQYDSFVVESNHFQSMLGDQLKTAVRNANLSIRIREAENRKNKGTRIQALEPMLSQGQLLLNRRQQTLIDQLERFPHGAHDDGPDALEMAVVEASKRRRLSRLPSYVRASEGPSPDELMQLAKEKTGRVPRSKSPQGRRRR